MRSRQLACFLALVCTPLFSQEDRTLLKLKHTQANFEQELAKMNSKFQNVDLVLESMRDEVTALLKACKETQITSASSQTNRFHTFEKNFDKVTSDLKQLKQHSNELTSCHDHLEKKIEELEKILKLQAEEIRTLESAMRSLTSAFEKPSKKKQRSTTYRVKKGDTLEKIAQDHGVSLSKLKNENNLTNDTIRSGQELIIPSS